MTKASAQLLVLIVVFFALWFGLSQIDYVKTFHLTGLGNKTEKKIGDAIMHTLHETDMEAGADSAARVLALVEARLRAGNREMPVDIQIHLISSKEVNAFALPGNHIIVYTGLIKHCDSVEELCGVLAHEIAHISKRHIMKKMAGEMGAGVLASVTSGNTVVINRIIKLLSSTAFERKQESEADEVGVKYLINAHINPAGFTSFMLKIADIQQGEPELLEWVSTHPESKKRADAIQLLIGNGHHDYSKVIDTHDWEVLKNASH